MKRFFAILMTVAIASSGCFKVSTTPSAINSTSKLLGGIWVTVESVPGATPNSSCTNFRWAVTEYTGTTGSGTYSATCFGNVNISGSAQGTLSGVNVTWSATATATIDGQPQTCAINLSGVATLETDKIRVPYSGTTCVGPVSGTEILRR
jgi:hypothetical protein